MSGKDGKRAKGRRTLYSHSKNSFSSSASNSVHSRIGAFGFGVENVTVSPKPFQTLGNSLAVNINDVATELGITLNPSHEDAMRITELMDAPIDLDMPAHSISRGPNPYLERCMYCNTPRTPSQDGEECLELIDLQFDGNPVINNTAQSQSYSSLKLEIWTCLSCRKVAGNFQSFLEANCPQSSYDLPYLHDSCIDPLTCSHCQEERVIHEKDQIELQELWIELHSIVKDLYSTKEDSVFTQEYGDRLQFLIEKLCKRDPHQLFLRLESQVREIVVDIKSRLLEMLKDKGINAPDLALEFTSALLCYYDLVTKKSHLLAHYLGGLSEHLRRFKVTWELLNKYLFHSIAHNDTNISSSGPTILEQLRQGSVKYERSKDDPYSSIRKRLLKFQEEMSVVVVIWRDCQQLIESYCQEEVKNTQQQVSSKARSFISQQRQFLKEQLLKDPIVDSETMKNFMSVHKTSTERVLCHLCKRERCTCDECTITHMITCGIINSNKGDVIAPPNSFNFPVDSTRTIIDITPPSMSSTTSTSGSVSPINIEEKLTTFYDCDRVLQEEFKQELSDALRTCAKHDGKVSSISNEDIDGNAGDDEEEDDDDDDDDVDEDDYTDNQDACIDEPHAVQILSDLKDADELWEVVQCPNQQHYHHHLLCDRLNTQHSCAQCHQVKADQTCVFQPKLEFDISRQIDTELVRNSITSGGLGRENVISQVNGDVSNATNLCATCQCHACLNQSGHIISTTLPIQMPVSPSPSEFHLYPHIHGLPQHNQQRYVSDLSSQLISSIQLPVKLDFTEGIQEQLYHSYGDWDNTLPRPGSLASQHHQQHHQRLSALSASLPPPPPPLVTSASTFMFDYASHLVTHTTNTSTTNTTSAFKSVVGKQFSSVLTSPSNMDASEGSSVDPSKPLDLPQSCLNSTTSANSLMISCPVSVSLAPSAPLPGGSVSTKSSTACHSNPQCSRPSPLGGNAISSRWERGHHCKKSPASSNYNNKQTSGVQVQHQAYNLGVNNSVQASTALPPPQANKNSSPAHHHKEEVIRSLRSLPCSHSSNPMFRPSTGTPTSTAVAPPVSTGQNIACNNSLSALVSNIAVNTSSPCNDPECEAHHHDDNCDSVDDSCSEKSSSTSTSNQKEGKYCDCCYCEFFGHNNTQVAKTSTNYIEMKDRLRKKLKKRSESKHKQVGSKNGLVQDVGKEESKDPLEKKGLEALLSFINGTEEETKVKQLTAKAAKRARQKQKRLEEKAKLDKNSLFTAKDHQIEKEQNYRHLVLNPATLPQQTSMAKSISKKSQSISDRNVLNTSEPTGIIDAHLKQEMNRSSFIIESTRSTIVPTQRNVSKQSKPNNVNNVDNSTQHKPATSLKQQQVKGHTDSTSQSKSNGIVSTPVNKMENGKSNKQLSNEQQPNHRGSQQKPAIKTAPGNNTATPQVASDQLIGLNSTISKSQVNPDVRNGSLSQHKTSSTPSGALPSNVILSLHDSPGSGSSASQSPSCGTRMSSEQVKTACKTKKNKKKNKTGDINGVDEIFLPKSESELDGDVDEFERELEEFKRFCFEPAEPKERRKIAVNVNLKDIFKKKNGLV
ncbi:protein FAM193A-like isoform X2 [Biomphalaria pfeifferi]|uniref:Protein FAM193A-like isoform X2 n=1 Tax=Biomphalaria pfeifferi TaxID=112525 RepID=A0AAD8CE59_BIOPF|nr:protein FAM193A-like isoform X2 [Biomphalaria pfeifferi]